MCVISLCTRDALDGAARGRSTAALGVMAEPLRMSFALVGTGWSTCVVEAGGASVQVTASYLSDALGDLVLSAFAVASGFRTVEFGFAEEPGEYRWVVEVGMNTSLRLRLLEFSELWGYRPNDEGRSLLDVSMTSLDYLKAVQQCATAVLEQHGAKGYLAKWVANPFPERQLALLNEAISRWEA
jgi:hypothetical protein